MLKRAPVLVCFVLVLGTLAAAAPKDRPTPLLTSAYINQLESWLGQTPIILRLIFQKAVGDGQTALDFHTAVDGLGPTILVMRARRPELAEPQIVGGFDPLSWATDGYHYQNTNEGLTAFIFNFTANQVLRHKLLADHPAVTDAATTKPITARQWDPRLDMTIFGSLVMKSNRAGMALLTWNTDGQ